MLVTNLILLDENSFLFLHREVIKRYEVSEEKADPISRLIMD
jgi:hypothetical protein